MIDFDLALEDCLERLANGEADLETCLTRYPEFATQLRPLLVATVRLERGQQVQPSAAFRARTRARLYTHMDAHPRQRKSIGLFFMPAWRAAVMITILALTFLITGTAFAQSALPGDALYNWKLTSEQVWRAVSTDAVSIDLTLAERRVHELRLVSSDPAKREIALRAYRQVLARLLQQKDPVELARILAVLNNERQQLEQMGITLPELNTIPISPTSIPSITTPMPILPLPTPTLPLPLPTLPLP